MLMPKVQLRREHEDDEANFGCVERERVGEARQRLAALAGTAQRLAELNIPSLSVIIELKRSVGVALLIEPVDDWDAGKFDRFAGCRKKSSGRSAQQCVNPFDPRLKHP